MDQSYILRKEFVDNRDPHGYFNHFRRQEANYESPSKRSFLNECIRQIYIISGNPMPLISIPVEYNKAVVWHKLNNLMRPSRMTVYQTSVQKVKRRLFRESKPRPRKCPYPEFNDTVVTECLYFRPFRPELGVKKISRNYLVQARKTVQTQIRHKLKRKRTDEDDEESDGEIKYRKRMSLFHTSQGIFNISQDVVRKVFRYNGSMALLHLQREQNNCDSNSEICRIGRKFQKLRDVLVDKQYHEHLNRSERVLEASIRSILYMKTLMNLMVAQQDDRNLCI